MAKLTLTDITSGYNAATKQNANNGLIEAAIENTLSLDGTTPNAMSAQLDMGNNRIINVADGVGNQDLVTVVQLDALEASLQNDHGGLGGLTDDDHTQYLLVDGTRALTGDLTTAGLSCADTDIARPVIKDYGITHTTPTIAANVIIYDLSLSNSFDVSLTANITTTTLSNPPASGTYGEITIRLKQDGTGSRTVAWPASIAWPGGTAPIITTAANSVDRVVLATIDGGTTWDGNFSQDYS